MMCQLALDSFREHRVQTDIYVETAPSFAGVRRGVRQIPRKMSDARLAKLLGYLRAYRTAHAGDRLASDQFYKSVCSHAATGHVPRDPWLYANAYEQIRAIEQEMKERGIFDDYCYFIMV